MFVLRQALQIENTSGVALLQLFFIYIQLISAKTSRLSNL